MRSSVLLGFRRMVLDPIKHVLRVFLNVFKNISGKVCVNRVHNNDAFVNVGNQHTRKHLTQLTNKEEVLSGFTNQCT